MNEFFCEDLMILYILNFCPLAIPTKQGSGNGENERWFFKIHDQSKIPNIGRTTGSSKVYSISNVAWENYVFLDFRGGLGEASVSKASPNEEKSINQLPKNGSTIDKGKKNYVW
ncbi:MAG: hypothetical protein UE068_01830 [Paludibacteraceae bacterium]|nr:hypothetical protein [Paludibacteraceae bacterium]